jgi:hypothetical protein
MRPLSSVSSVRHPITLINALFLPVATYHHTISTLVIRFSPYPNPSNSSYALFPQKNVCLLSS